MPTPAPSFQYEAQSNDLLSPVWTLRFAPASIFIALALAMLVFKAGKLHEMLLGFCIGMLLPLTLMSFQVTGLTMKHDQARSNVQDLHVTP